MADNVHVISDEERDRRLANSPSPDKVTPEHIDATVKNVRFIHAEPTSTIAIVTLRNDFTVIGHSACADPVNFDREIGERIALDDAKKQIWPLEGYLLRQRLWEAENPPQPIAPMDSVS